MMTPKQKAKKEEYLLKRLDELEVEIKGAMTKTSKMLSWQAKANVIRELNELREGRLGTDAR